MGRILFVVLLTIGAIGLEWYLRRDLRRTLIASGTFLLLISFAIVGMTMRAVLPIFLAHLVLLAVAWLALFHYLWKGRYLWWIYWLPALTLLLFVGLNFFEGSRYEH